MLFKKLYPGHRKKEIESCIASAAGFIEDIQKPDGSWYGYMIWFWCLLLVSAKINKYLIMKGMEIGEYASSMVHGLALEG